MKTIGFFRPVVGHLDFTFFAPSQTFIYFYLTHFQRTRPICLSLGTPVINRRRFPFPSGDCYGFPNRGLWALWRLVEHFSLPRREALRTLVQHTPDAQIAWAREILARRGARLLHAHFGGIGYRALALQDALGIPLVTTFYGTDIVGKPDWKDWPHNRSELFKRGDLILVEGPFMRQRLVELGCPLEKVQIQHIAIDVKQIPFRERKPRSQGKTVILFAGRFEEKKGLPYAIEAVRDVLARGLAVEFRLIGSGQLRGQVRRLIREYGLEEQVKLLGFLDYQQYLTEMGKADIFLHPSVVAADGDSEGGAPTVILEAQALGLPVVSTIHADIPYITRPGESARLVPERDSVALADALEDLITHPEIWGPMGRAGREHVEARHDIQREAVKLEERYAALMGL